jgi:hypothetical protein
MFDERAWHYRHYRLGPAEAGKVPPLASRFIPREHVGSIGFGRVGEPEAGCFRSLLSMM